MLAIDDLVVAYPHSQHPALNHLSMVIDASAAIVGPSGAGKSTLLKALMGLVPLRRGSLWVEGAAIARRPLTARRLLAYMPQENVLPREAVLQEYLRELAILDGYPAHKLTRAVADILDLVHLSDASNHRMKWLSGGMQRRALLAGTLLRRTPWILLDEPSLGLDPDEQASVRSLIRSQARHRRVIVTTQCIEDAGSVPNRIVVLKGGSLAANTTWEELRGFARGHLYEKPWTDQEDVVSGANWRPVAGGTRVRTFYEAEPADGANAIAPSAEEGYLWLMIQGRGAHE
jgi:ABC-2 type transport system ATP-binding protein